jgi:hypothetical protein
VPGTCGHIKVSNRGEPVSNSLTYLFIGFSPLESLDLRVLDPHWCLAGDLSFLLSIIFIEQF